MQILAAERSHVEATQPLQRAEGRKRQGLTSVLGVVSYGPSLYNFKPGGALKSTSPADTRPCFSHAISGWQPLGPFRPESSRRTGKVRCRPTVTDVALTGSDSFQETELDPSPGPNSRDFVTVDSPAPLTLGPD